MSLPTTKTELIGNLTKAYRLLDQEFDDIDFDEYRKNELEGEVSCCDIIAYQIGWGKLLLSWEHQELAGSKPIMPSANFKWNQLGALAHSFYQQYAIYSLAELRKEYETLVDNLIDWISSLPDDALFQPQVRDWTGKKWAMVKWIQINTVAPYQTARKKVRAWKKKHI